MSERPQALLSGMIDQVSEEEIARRVARFRRKQRRLRRDIGKRADRDLDKYFKRVRWMPFWKRARFAWRVILGKR